MGPSDALGEAASSFTDDLKATNQRILNDVTSVELPSAETHDGSNTLGRVEDVEQPLPIAPHNTTASASTLSRIRSLRPFTVAT